MEPMQNLSEEMAIYVEQSQEQIGASSHNEFDPSYDRYVKHSDYMDYSDLYLKLW
jgi:hypothetical protein